jgi:hypothetical protein
MPSGDNLFSYQLEWNVTDSQKYGAQLGSLNYEGGQVNCSGMFFDMTFSGSNVTVGVRFHSMALTESFPQAVIPQ